MKEQWDQWGKERYGERGWPEVRRVYELEYGSDWKRKLKGDVQQGYEDEARKRAQRVWLFMSCTVVAAVAAAAYYFGLFDKIRWQHMVIFLLVIIAGIGGIILLVASMAHDELAEVNKNLRELAEANDKNLQRLADLIKPDKDKHAPA
jgi:hypothetical protein